jgi:hypothetical protein
MLIHARLPAISGLAAIFLLLSTSIASWAGQALTLADYQRLKAGDRGTLEMVLAAMYEAAIYAQTSMVTPDMCFTPIPIAGSELIAMVDAELAEQTSPLERDYGDEDRLAMVLVSALKSEDVCR